MKSLEYLGKILFIIPIAYFGFGHLANANALTGLVPAFLPLPVIWVYFTGIMLILAAVAVVLGKKAKLATQLLGLMLLLFAVLVHLPGGLNGNTQSMSIFFKDVALAGGAWFISSHLSN